MPENTLERFILLPERGLRVRPEDRRAFAVVTGLSAARSTLPALDASLPESGGRQFRVLDSVAVDGPKLVEADPQTALALRASGAGLRIEPERHYQAAIVASFKPDPTPQAATGPPLVLHIVEAPSRRPLAGVSVAVFTDFESHLGAHGVTGANGEVSLELGSTSAVVDRVYVSAPPTGFWGAFRSRTQLGSGDEIGLPPVDTTANDCLRRHYGTSRLTDGDGVKVGVLDTGIDLSHPDLQVDGGRNTARGEPKTEFGDNGAGHGTHVAGIIGARGEAPTGLRGLAPGASLRSYRVFGQNRPTTTNYEVVKAMVFAVDDECDVLNLSLGGLPPDDVIRDAILDTSEHGTLVVAAAGNDDRQAVSRPASYAPTIAVSAFGCRGTFPPGAYEEGYVELDPPGTDPNDFMASFSNIGREVFMAAPGVGVVSTVPGSGYAPMSGTSMACPVVSGCAARLLAANPSLLSMSRDTFRTRAITNLLSRNAVRLGFPFEYEGSGRPG